MGFDGDQLGNCESLNGTVQTFVTHTILKQQREVPLNRREARQTFVPWLSQGDFEEEIKVQLSDPYLLFELALGRNLRMQLTEFSHHLAVHHDLRGAGWMVVLRSRR